MKLKTKRAAGCFACLMIATGIAASLVSANAAAQADLTHAKEMATLRANARAAALATALKIAGIVATVGMQAALSA